MAKASKLWSAIANPYDARSLAGQARRRRWDELLRRFPDFRDMSVVDLGGDTRYWRNAPLHPAHVTLVDPFPHHLDAPEDWMTTIVGDACNPDLGLSGFDLCHSNSVIEHVGGSHRRRQFAANVGRSAIHHWIQTPYRYFPIEPHWVLPGFQFLPLAARAWIGPRLSIAPPKGDPVASALQVELLSITELRQLFPTSEMWTERIGGIVKSVVMTG